MLSNLITVSGQVITLFLMMIAGYCLGKTKLLPRSALPALTNVVVYLALPCMLIGAFEMEATSERVHGFLWVLAATVLVHGLNFAVAHFGIRDPDNGRKRVLVDCAVFSNCGFMGYPLLASLMGDTGLFYGSAYNLVFTTLLWTAGISYLQHRKGPLRLRNLILNPGIIGMALGFSVFLLQIQLPPVLETTVDYLGNVAISLPMLIIGCQLAHADLKKLLHDRWSWVAAGLRLLARAFGRRLVFWAHDHDVYCPRRYYYTPFGRRNCARACSRFRCAGCALLASPRNWQGGGIAGQLGFLLRDAPRRLDILRETGTVVISDFMRNNLLRNGFREENIHLLSPFIRVEPEARRPEPAPELRLLFLGQLLRGKGCDLFLEMLRALGGPFRAVIAGDGNDRAGLEAMSRAFGFGERVRFLGWCGRPEELFAEADAAVFPFRWQEPFGLCGLEAAAHGVPVVAFDLGGVREWLIDGVTGIAVKPFDGKAMAAAVARLRDSAGLRREMGANGRRLAAERFSEERFLAGFGRLCGGSA